jgi:hypothetical protein
MFSSLLAHPFVLEAILIYVVTTAVGTMPSPSDKSSALYKWLFSFSHSVTGQLPRVLATLAPGSAIGKAMVGADNLAAQQACKDAEKENK